MDTLKGTVSKLKIIQYSQHPLVYFRLAETNCLIATHSLTFLADVADGMRLIVTGTRNKRGQLIVAKYAVLGKTKLMMDFEHYQSVS